MPSCSLLPRLSSRFCSSKRRTRERARERQGHLVASGESLLVQNARGECGLNLAGGEAGCPDPCSSGTPANPTRKDFRVSTARCAGQRSCSLHRVAVPPGHSRAATQIDPIASRRGHINEIRRAIQIGLVVERRELSRLMTGSYVVMPMARPTTSVDSAPLQGPVRRFISARIALSLAGSAESRMYASVRADQTAGEIHGLVFGRAAHAGPDDVLERNAMLRLDVGLDESNSSRIARGHSRALPPASSNGRRRSRSSSPLRRARSPCRFGSVRSARDRDRHTVPARLGVQRLQARQHFLRSNSSARDSEEGRHCPGAGSGAVLISAPLDQPIELLQQRVSREIPTRSSMTASFTGPARYRSSFAQSKGGRVLFAAMLAAWRNRAGSWSRSSSPGRWRAATSPGGRTSSPPPIGSTTPSSLARRSPRHARPLRSRAVEERDERIRLTRRAVRALHAAYGSGSGWRSSALGRGRGADRRAGEGAKPVRPVSRPLFERAIKAYLDRQTHR